MSKPVRYEPCDRCASSRASGDHERAIACRLCNGRGLVPALGEDVCNGCGGSMASGTRSDDRQIAAGLHKHQLWGGYGSPGLTDTMKYTFSMCEHCLRLWFVGCKVPPKVERYDLVGIRPDEEETYAEDHERYEYEQWRQNLGFANAHLHGICNQTRTCQKPAKWSLVLSESVTEHCLCDEHKHAWDNCSNAAVVPFVANDFWAGFSKVTETVAPATPVSGDVYRIDGELPDLVVSGIMAVIWDTTHTHVQASLRCGPEQEKFLRVRLTAVGALAVDKDVPDLQLPITESINDSGFRRRDPHLEGWLHGSLLAARHENKILDIVLVSGWKRAPCKEEEDS